jgi:hypothetical protein
MLRQIAHHPRYIFLNMFTGVVVESFAYVYQMPGGASLDRDQMREYTLVLQSNG